MTKRPSHDISHRTTEAFLELEKIEAIPKSLISRVGSSQQKIRRLVEILEMVGEEALKDLDTTKPEVLTQLLSIPKQEWQREQLSIARWLLEKLEGPAEDITPIRNQTHEAALAA